MPPHLVTIDIPLQTGSWRSLVTYSVLAISVTCVYVSLPVNIHGTALGFLKTVCNMTPERVGQERRWVGLGVGEKVQGGFNAVQNSWLKLGGPFLSFSQANSPLT